MNVFDIESLIAFAILLYFHQLFFFKKMFCRKKKISIEHYFIGELTTYYNFFEGFTTLRFIFLEQFHYFF